MDRIVLEVDDSTGKVYRNFPPENKQRLNEVICLLLRKAANDISQSDYKKKMDEIRLKAISAGLTPEILEELLASNG